jgi:hypothetical protein
MAGEEQYYSPTSSSETGTRLKDLEEKNSSLKERMLLLGDNLIKSKKEMQKEIQEIKLEHKDIKEELRKLQIISKEIIGELEKFVKKDEMILLEKMLKDFQPLEFMRKKDVEELIKKSK